MQLQDPRTHTPTVRILVEYCKRYQEGGLGVVSRSGGGGDSRMLGNSTRCEGEAMGGEEERGGRGAGTGEAVEEVMKHTYICIYMYIYIYIDCFVVCEGYP